MSTSKKGITIGAALRNRMRPEDAEEQAREQGSEQLPQDPPPSKAGTSRRQAAEVPVAEPTSATVPLAASLPASPADDPLESFNTRLRRSVQRRLKVYGALHDVKIQDVVNEALDAYLREKQA